MSVSAHMFGGPLHDTFVVLEEPLFEIRVRVAPPISVILDADAAGEIEYTEVVYSRALGKRDVAGNLVYHVERIDFAPQSRGNRR